MAGALLPGHRHRRACWRPSPPGSDRILLTLATGTGKTFIAFQIAWKLFHSRWNLDWRASRPAAPRILFLADRNILADQAYNAFSAFPDDALVRIDPDDIRKKGRVPKNGSIFFTIFQTFMSGRTRTAARPYFGEYPPDFFDFIVIDECHRGGANDESTWRGILEYFAPAVQLGLTATPKRTGQRRHLRLFRRAGLHLLAEGRDQRRLPDAVQGASRSPPRSTSTSTRPTTRWSRARSRPASATTEKRLQPRSSRSRSARRTASSCSWTQIDQREKTLVFCATQDHALAVRDLINQMKTSTDPNYCVRVTANDGALGDQYLRDFQDNEKTIPTILTTSQKLSTGVDARNVRNIVLMRPINSMIEFKQIIGRGTRLFDGKDYFTIYDFVKAHQHFSDPEWDGEPLEPEPTPRRRAPATADRAAGRRAGAGRRRRAAAGQKIKVKLADGKERTIQHMMATTFWSPDGTPMSAAAVPRSAVRRRCPSSSRTRTSCARSGAAPTRARRCWPAWPRRASAASQLAEMQQMIDAEKSDLFDVLAYIAFAAGADHPRGARPDAASRRSSSPYDDKQQAFLDFVLSQYVSEGVDELDEAKLPELLHLKYRTISDAMTQLGGPAQIRAAFIGFQQHLYS